MTSPKTSPALTATQKAKAAALVTEIIKLFRSGSPADAAAKKAQLDKLEAYVNQEIQILLTAWQAQADSAITDSAYPVPEESRAFFYIALAGNLVWAATCFLNPAAASELVLIKLMSVGGAAIGSGVAQQLVPPDPGPEDAKRLCRQFIAKKRGELEEYFKPNRRSWAAALDGIAAWEDAGGSTDRILDTFDQFIWEKMFPGINYDVNRFETIRAQMLAMIESTLADYNRQWARFKQDHIWLGGGELKRRGIVFKPVLKITWNGKVLTGRVEDHEPGKFY